MKYEECITGEYCFRVFVNNSLTNPISYIIYEITGRSEYKDDKNYFSAFPIATSNKRLPRTQVNRCRRFSVYTKCKSKTIEELKSEYPEIFI